MCTSTPKEVFYEKSFADRIESLRGNKTQKEFAKQLGVPLNTYTNWTRGITKPTCDALITACTVLGVSADWLLGLPSPSAPSLPSPSPARPDAPSGKPEDYWRDLTSSQQKTISSLTQLLVAAQKPTAPAARAGGRSAIKTA